MNILKIFAVGVAVVCLTACGSGDITSVPDPEFAMVLDARLPVDENGFYHLTLNRSTTQTIHRVSGRITVDGFGSENTRVLWESSHSWTLSDSLMVIVRKECPYDDDITCVYIINEDQPLDTLILSQYEGEEVPTVNCCNLSAPSGEINTVFAPVWWMEGDTVTIRATAMFTSTVNVVDSVRVILE